MSPQSDRKQAASGPNDRTSSPHGSEPRQDPRRPDASGPPSSGPHDLSEPTHRGREPERPFPAAEVPAKDPLEEAVSPVPDEPASDAPEVPAEAPVGPPDVALQDEAARRFGYDSFAALVKDAVAFPVDRGEGLFICELKDGRWIRFDRESWPKHELFPDREAAMKPAQS